MSDPAPNAPQRDSGAYRLPAADRDFLLGDSMRGVRFLLEFTKADEVLRAWNIRSTIVVFGSARVAEDGPPDHARWYAEARRFAALASREGGALDQDGAPRENVIATGGGPGTMAAANRGAFDAGAPSIGFNISLPLEQEPNAWSTPELTFRFHYFAMRKMHLAMRANALVAFPGGFGTLDELFEILTLRQTGKMRTVPVILVDKPFWTDLIRFDLLVAHGLVSESDLDLIQFASDGEDAWRRLAGSLVAPRPDSRRNAPGRASVAAES
ncbi:MAG: TIGR00730 family Rossman fold protein [Brevundimonas sp.]|uniref:LOG family protein n=1 Tax=Brevundimonas sp. TaxID=1871086 RepID=UPI002489BC29|nr:TIGR00730 family Rossman fold protein [Brevundimonas sp.]MDI1326152.1 TIGR00730 family Rossman fold protein [Brevundimonas sp.]